MYRSLRAFLRRYRRPRVLPSRDAYALWSRDYPPYAHNPLMQAEQDAMLTLMPDLTACCVLDIGAGSGRYTRIAREHHADTVISLDDSLSMLRADTLPHPVQASADALPLPTQCANVAVCALMIGHLAQPGALLAELGRVLKPNGVALISDFHPSLAEVGAQRTFEHGGRHYAVEHHIHSIDRIHQLADAHAFTIDAMQEPVLHKDGRMMPVVVVYGLRKK